MISRLNLFFKSKVVITYWGRTAKKIAVFQLLLFQGEKRKKKKAYSGFHNWYQFYLEQGQNKIKDVTVKPNSYTYNTEVSINVCITAFII